MTKQQMMMRAGTGVLVLAIVAIAVDRLLIGGSAEQSTNDAFVTADYSVVAPKAAGLIDQVAVQDNQAVKAGQLLAHIDDRDYRTAVAVADAALAAARARLTDLAAELDRQQPVIRQTDATLQADQAALDFAQDNAVRYRRLSSGGAGTVEQRQQADTRLLQARASLQHDKAVNHAARQQVIVLKAEQGQAEAGVEQAQAALDQARLDLSYTRIVAPVDGVVGERSVRVGNYVHVGTPLLAVVPVQAAYVVANYQETQLEHMRPGQKVTIHVDTYGGEDFNGTVDSLAPASGVAFSPIAPDNATGNFTKVVQRIPVKIWFDPGQQLSSRLRVGMSVETTVHIGSSQARPVHPVAMASAGGR